MTTVDRIFQLMKEDGLTAKDFALKVGVSQGNITDWKTGRAKPSIESLQKIAKQYNVRLEWLTGDSDLRTNHDLLNEYLIQQDINSINSTIIANWDDFKKTGIKESQLEDFVEILSVDRNKTPQENCERVVKYVQKFKPKQRKYLKKLILKILDDLEITLTDLGVIHSLMSQMDNEYKLKNEESIKEKSKFHMCPVYGKISAGIPNWAEECLEGYLPIDPNLMGIVNPDECFFLLVNGQSMNKVIRNGAYALIRKQDIVENGEICAVLVNGFEATLKKFSKQGDLVILEPMSDDPSFTTQVYNKDTQIRILGKYIGKFEMNK